MITDTDGSAWSVCLPEELSRWKAIEMALAGLSTAVDGVKLAMSACQDALELTEGDPDGTEVHMQWASAMEVLRQANLRASQASRNVSYAWSQMVRN